MDDLLKPTDNRFIDLINDLDSRVKSLERSPQPFVGDWLEITDVFTYTSSTRITASNSNVDMTAVFSVGDPIRYKQGGDYKYGYVYGVTALTLDIMGGDDYSIANSSITDIARGLKPNANGFPFVFDITNTVNWRGAGGNITTGDETNVMWMTGPICWLDMHMDNATTTGNDTPVMDLPITANTDADIPFYSCTGISNSTPLTADFKIGGSVSWDGEIQLITDSGFGTWANSSGTGWDVTVGYLIDL